MMVYAAHLAKIKDPDFWRRLEKQILLQQSTNLNWDLSDMVNLIDTLQDYK